MDENTYRRVISRNVDEFTSGNSSKSGQNEENRMRASNLSDSYASERHEEAYNRNTGARHQEGSPYASRTSYMGQRESRPPGNEGKCSYYTRSVSSDYNQDYWTKKTNINLKQIKAVGINCAKSLTNKLINLSTSASSSYNNSHMYNASRYNNKYNYSSSQMNASDAHGPTSVGNTSPATQSYGVNSYVSSTRNNQIYSLNSIANRISTTDDPIRTHRELVAVIEHTLTHRNYLIEIKIEKDRFGSPSIDSINRFTLINKQLLEKIVNYSLGKRDCCVFLVKFATWKMRSTKKPEEVILSIELIAQCVRIMGGFFLSLFTKSLMKTFRRLLFLTHFKNSITSNVKKKLVKLLGKGTQFVHPGVSTDIRIHIFKLKILYLIQLYYETFLFEQDEYPVFYEGYKEMRLRGVKFPNIKDEDKNTINKGYVFSNSYHGGPGAYEVGGQRESLRSRGERSYYSELNIDLNELDQLLHNINNNNIDTDYIARVRTNLLRSIEILSNKRNLDQNGSQLLDKILKLNDSLLMLLNKNGSPQSRSERGGYGGDSSHGVTINRASYLDNDNGYNDNTSSSFFNVDNQNNRESRGREGKDPREAGNLLFEGSENESGPREERSSEFEFFKKEHEKEEENTDNEGSSIKENLDDIFNFISLTSFKSKNSETSPENETKSDMNELLAGNELSDDEQLEFEDEDELINNFINSNNFNSTFNANNNNNNDNNDNNNNSSDNNDNNNSDNDDNNNSDNNNNNSDNDNNNNGNKEGEGGLNAGQEEDGEDKEDEDNGGEKRTEKNLSQLVRELDNLEIDFGHMSATNF